MPRFARTRGKRYYRKRRVLAKSNIFSRKSASAQAKQINALRKRISYVYRRTRPETQRKQISGKYTFKNDAFADTYDLNRPIAGISNSSNLHGAWANLYNYNWRAIFEYSDNYNIDVAVDHQRSCSFRVLIWQAIKSGDSQMNIGDVLLNSASSTDYELNTIRPLREGVSSVAKILCDRTYTISNANPIKRVNVNIRRLLNLHKEPSQAYPRGDIYVAVVTSGLHWDSTFNQQLDYAWVSDINTH